MITIWCYHISKHQPSMLFRPFSPCRIWKHHCPLWSIDVKVYYQHSFYCLTSLDIFPVFVAFRNVVRICLTVSLLIKNYLTACATEVNVLFFFPPVSRAVCSLPHPLTSQWCWCSRYRETIYLGMLPKHIKVDHRDLWNESKINDTFQNNEHKFPQSRESFVCMVGASLFVLSLLTSLFQAPR